jgi:lysophospholipid acyltransferase (LPLAT)-like uncharacterized protein
MFSAIQINRRSADLSQSAPDETGNMAIALELTTRARYIGTYEKQLQGFDELSVIKKILKSNGAKAVISFIAAGYIWLVYRTSRWQVINGDAPHRLMTESKPFILAFWHGRLLMMPISVQKTTNVHVMISHHGDGEIIARTIKHWGQNSIRGSATKGAAAAIKQMMKILKSGEVAVITPDGPRGPRMRSQEGVVRLAALSGVPVYPVSFSTTRGKILDSWDRFFVAAPFSRGVVIWGDGIKVPRRDEKGAHQESLLEIEDSLTAITQKADELCGRETVLPESRDKVIKPHKKQAEA